MFPGAGKAVLPELEHWYACAPAAAGTRITRLGSLASYLSVTGVVGRLATSLLGSETRPVRAIAFNKSSDANWSLGWHQDRTINVRQRADVEGYGPWTIKQGSLHVQPPFALVETMITLRIHLDPVTPDNSPLDVALGSHRGGYIAESQVPKVVEASRILACLAQPGDVWAYATPILHASQRSTATGRRRVLQVDFSAESLPPPLAWALDMSGEE